ncbi:hypothetical protein Taro_040630 [Colocasia esculenta]|uniref:Uncharacterized protein n=1 Tax=Colocasia esculenta TaxID=4460 RepID=A0A843WDP9_COLES|nr:hypothetical protein [Colocasia esculenta]
MGDQHAADHRRRGDGGLMLQVGNSASQCTWTFHQPIYGPQSPPLGAPNGDVDGMVINLASMLTAIFTTPFGNSFYQDSPDEPLEAASACPRIYDKNAYPDYVDNLYDS